MTSGIYKLTFADGSYYIGKSNIIERRWTEHYNKFIKGTAASKLQECYLRNGMPKPEVLIECHEDHIDILEAFYINALWSSGILNTSRPTAPNREDVEYLVNGYRDLSTAEHCKLIKSLQEKINHLETAIKLKNKEISKIKRGTIISEIEEELIDMEAENYRLIDKLEKREDEIKRLKSRNLFDRIFNFY